MPDNPLKVVATENTKPQPSAPSMRSSRNELQAKMERLWLTNPEQFNPKRNCIERERLKRVDEILRSRQKRAGPAVELGCGYGFVSRSMRDAGWEVQAVDISTNALKTFTQQGAQNIKLVQDALPSTKLEDDAYELVVCTEVIGYLEARDYRLLMAELSRLVKRDGTVICSTAIDINSEDALQRFGALAETEFLIERWHFSHHLLLIRLKNFFEAPENYVKASQETEVRKQELQRRTGISRWWYRINTTSISGYVWRPFMWLAYPFVQLLKQNQAFMLFLEKICRLFWSESGISHALFIGKRRPLIMPTKADLESVEPKGKRQVWE